MEKDQEPPFPREPWQGLLQDRADAPPETTDARIRAAARKAVTPSTARWWLPASLAASFLLAVVIVQLQYGSEEKPGVVTERDLSLPAAAPPPPPAMVSPDLPRKRAADSAGAARQESAPSELHDYVAPEESPADADAASELGEVAANGSRIGGPEQELKASSEMVAEPAAKARAPEAWYADIEALRTAGRIEEADAELARFEAAYPGWLEKHRPQKP